MYKSHGTSFWLDPCFSAIKNVSKLEQANLQHQQEKHLSKIIEFTKLLQYSRQENSTELMKKCFGFYIEKEKSKLEEAGNGVFVRGGIVPMLSIVAFYPGILSDVNVCSTSFNHSRDTLSVWWENISISVDTGVYWSLLIIGWIKLECFCDNAFILMHRNCILSNGANILSIHLQPVHSQMSGWCFDWWKQHTSE